MKKLHKWIIILFGKILVILKYSFTGDKAKAAFYKYAIKNSTQNTKKAIAEIQKSLTNPTPHSSNVPPSQHQGERYKS
ncbi:hypothetical protein ACE5D9_02415 [Rickettsia sp. 2024-CO-Wats]|uniref:hypothetical protein n=1 Tax=unclassified Rickettsia TaxID=114295 RepID=UPI003C7273EF